MIKILTLYAMTMILWCLLSEQWNLYKHIKTNITCNVTCFPRTWRHKTFHLIVLFQTATFEIQRYLFSTYMTSFSAYNFPELFQQQKIAFSSQNVFLPSILQHVIASQSNHINTMLLNEMILASLQKLKIWIVLPIYHQAEIYW